MKKTYLFSMQIGMPQTKALKSIGYTDTVLFNIRTAADSANLLSATSNIGLL